MNRSAYFDICGNNNGVYKFAKTLNNASAAVETALNYGACVPILGVIASVATVKFGELQLVLGAATAVTGAIGLGISHLVHSKSHTKKQWNMVTKLGLEHTIHGALNILSGLGEIVLALSTFGLGNLLLIIPYHRNDFKPYYRYGQLTFSH